MKLQFHFETDKIQFGTGLHNKEVIMMMITQNEIFNCIALGEALDSTVMTSILSDLLKVF